MTKQEAAARLSALLKMTTENGCTEHEAITAMQKARKIMDEYGLTETEAELEKEELTSWMFFEADSQDKIFMRYCWDAIQELCGVYYLKCSAGHKMGKRPYFTGFEGDVNFAQWLTITLCSMAKREARNYLKTLPPNKRKALQYNSFIVGISMRVKERMLEEIKSRKVETSGKGLIVINKQTLIDRRVKEMMNVVNAKKSRKIDIEMNSLDAGKKAAEKVTWNRPISETEQLKLT